MSDQPNTETKPTFGRIAPQDALKAIKAENSRAGLTVSESDESAMAHHLASDLRIDMGTGRTFLVDGAGNEAVGISTSAYIEKLQASAAPTLHDKAELVPVSGGMNTTERAVATNKALRAAKTESKAAEAVELVRRHGNPWRTGNVTHRHFIQNVNPTLADQLRSTAGQ